MGRRATAHAPDGTPASRPRRRPGSLRRRFLPPQHGAWAMLAVPYLAGLVAAGFEWPDVPLLVAWIVGYLLSYYVFQAVKSRRPRRYRDQFIVYAGVAVPLAAVVVAARPAVLYYAPAFAALFAVNAWYAWRRQERAFLNDVASVVQSCLMVVVVAAVADATAGSVVTVFVLCLAYFLGTIVYVKTMIRERDNPAYRRWSVGYHLVALAVATWLEPVSAVLFGWLLVRAAVLPGRGLVPKRVGMIEIANSAALLIVVAVT